MSELKPCPFCGGKVSVTYSSWDKMFNIWHHDKPCALIEPMQIDGSKANSLKEAINLWNRRAKTWDVLLTMISIMSETNENAYVERVEVVRDEGE